LTYRGCDLDLAPPWERVTVASAMRRWANLDIEAFPDDASFREHARAQGHDWVRDEAWDELFYKLFITHVEPHLGFPKPTILYEYPARFGALARRHPDRPHVAERFEVYAAGVELCNAFTELTDPVEQRDRLERERGERARLGREALPIDEDFLDAVAELPPCAGNALGVDRLVMLLTDEPTIERVTWFAFGALRAWAERQKGPSR
jgi:lysyl-tRNA synthetase class 2